ncbi:GNAT family N-acetyltransferase [Gilvibacter sp.]|uniref:GNAT family N-acetyltransferase n=1 Tax=Gilvibacter sp. TaxID=2729997 RepID=UPI0025B8F60B|nr:GNAT family N-acetyltransferase [Gilvibacter sp.]NQX77082.1 N-acetyltransferase family protein [Gilvibacter sp.]
MEIKQLKKKHFKEVAQIYSDGLDTGIATFETEVPDWKTWKKKFMKPCRFVALKDDRVVGWCALSPASKREVYKGVAESTVYIASEFRGQGIGRKLLKHLIIASKAAGFWTLQAGIFAENKHSIYLHEQCGFRIVGVRKRIAKRDGKWYDNVLMEHRNNIT